MKKLFCLMVILLTGCATTSAVPDTTFFRDQLKKHTLIVYKEGKTNFYDFTIDDFELLDYEPVKPQLKFELGI